MALGSLCNSFTRFVYGIMRKFNIHAVYYQVALELMTFDFNTI